ncbi:KEOPS complex subunit Pcc1 [Halogeometricum luteum]|uniref:BON domain-containing protein n=1 Tax=Halogeometricum luteum TaxID=2950537 RepID=A0ABU2FX89_9EURY|nr:KEOPS complex subunit Pcc1 [Halogeometricum sp. S3BR5-2]MDS0293159.1 hypothetical protein [Halogeometricum sp. S3BR5-2]
MTDEPEREREQERERGRERPTSERASERTADGPDSEDRVSADDPSTARTARLRTTHADAERVAASLRPDNTDSMSMVVEGDALVTTVERETTGGLQSTVDDTVVNLTVADAVIDTATNNL